MFENNFQNDLFEGRFHEKKAVKPRILSRYSKQRFLPHIRVPIEYTVIGAILVLIFVIIAYAVGVERGKRLPVERTMRASGEMLLASDQEEIPEAVYPEVLEGDLAGIHGEPGADEEFLEEAGELSVTEKSPEAEEKEVSGIGGAAYIVQLASFRNKRSAEREVKGLKRKGVKSGMAKKGDWYQVYAEGYCTVEEAIKAKEELNEDYADCYIRKVK
ncbi:MAG: SPOR domain-containing protein [Candidatus Omnitrophota bacterium]|nr:SPOR domain-containing protein [Candidatus Omnitrophota bacterium]